MLDRTVQIAGVCDVAEARMLIECGVDWIGFPLRLDVHPEDVSEAEAARIIASLAAPERAVLITYLDEPREIRELARALGVTWVQLHGPIEPPSLAALREAAPKLCIMKSLVVRDDNRAQLRSAVQQLSPLVDAFITDSFDPETGASGATGRTHDWSVSRELVALSPRPVILAGGLTPGNVRRAIAAVRPAGVDAHTGVEGPDGRKQPELVRRFVQEARAGFAEA